MPVDVTNPVLPVSGTVSVDNFPAVQAVREVTHPAHQPVQRTVSIDDWSVAFEGRIRSFNLPEVPEGKVLVVQQVSVLARVPAGQHVKAEISTQGPTIPAVHMIPLTLQGRFGGFDNWVGTENMTAYAGGTSPGRITVERNSSAGDVGPFETVRVSVTGYLVDEAP